MDNPGVVHETYLSVLFPSHSNLCLSHPMGRFPWDSHRNDIPMANPGHFGHLHHINSVKTFRKLGSLCLWKL